jgi:predicted MFS family arabinose efflux permease
MWFWRTLAPILVFQENKDPRVLGILSLASYGPVLLFSYPGGSLADRFDKRRIASIFQSISALNFVILAFWSHYGELSTVWIVVAASMESIAYALCKPSIQAMIYDIVGPEELTKAVSINTAQYSIAQLIGPVLASLIAIQIGESTALFMAALLYLPMITTMRLFLKRTSPSKRVYERSDSDQRKPSQFKKLVVFLVSVALGSIAIEGGVRVLAPQVAADLMSVPSAAGYLISAQAFGGILGILVILAIGNNVREMMMFRLGFAFFAFTIILYSLTTNFWIAVSAAICMGACHSVSFNIATAMIQKLSTRANRGRSSSFHSMALLGTRPVSGLTAGQLSSAYGWPVATRLFAFVAIIPVFIGTRMFKEHSAKETPANFDQVKTKSIDIDIDKVKNS